MLDLTELLVSVPETAMTQTVRGHGDIQLSWKNMNKVVLNIENPHFSVTTSPGVKSMQWLLFIEGRG